MGKGIVFRCSNCGHEETHLIGIGFANPSEREDAVKMIEAGDCGQIAKAALAADPSLKMAVNVSWALYQCPACFKSDIRKRVLSASGALKIRNHHFCDCGREMRYYRRGMQLICPVCRNEMSEPDEGILWD